MGIDISQLSPAAQQQAMRKIAEIERQKAARLKPKENKLHAEKVNGFLADGTPFTFASKREYQRYGELAFQERIGQIKNLELQKTYELIPAQKRSDGTKERAISYVADFVYEEDGKTIVEDSKGYRNPASATYKVFVMKRKLMLYLYGIEVREV